MLAAIVANITIPAEELEVLNAPAPVRIEAPAKAEPQPAAPAPAPAKVAAAPARPKPQPAPIKEPAKSAEAKTAAARDAKGKPDSKAVKEDPKAKKADTKAKKPEPKAKADPARIWVQVASGANEDTLSKAWKGVVAKSPTSFKGRSGWQLPFKATNRVVTGPFKTAAEAQAFVNTLSKNKLSGFVVNSEAGEKVTRLDP